MPELGDEIGRYVDAIAEPLTLDEVRRGAPHAGDGHGAVLATGSIDGSDGPAATGDDSRGRAGAVRDAGSRSDGRERQDSGGDDSHGQAGAVRDVGGASDGRGDRVPTGADPHGLAGTARDVGGSTDGGSDELPRELAPSARSSVRSGPARWVAVAAAIVAVVLVAGVLAIARQSVDVDVDAGHQAPGTAAPATTVAPGPPQAPFEVLDMREAWEPVSTLRSTVDANELATLWSNIGFGGSPPEVDLTRWVVVSITIPDDACPPTLTGFDRVGSVLTPAFVEPAVSCDEPYVPKTYVVAINRRDVSPSFTLRLPADPGPVLGYDERLLVVHVPAVADDGSAPDPTVELPTAPAWLTPYGAETPAPPVPDGWKVLEVGDIRFAVPPDWQTPMSTSCENTDPEVGGLVVVSLLPTFVDGNGSWPQSNCGAGPGEVASFVSITVAPTGDFRTSEPATIGTLSVSQFVINACGGCGPTSYRLDNGMEVAVSGPQAAAILATFTDSSSRRALQSGPVADRVGWRPVPYGDIGLSVPAAWPVDVLAGAAAGERPAGEVGTGNAAAPGSCGRALFPTSSGPRVALGGGLPVQFCPNITSFDLESGDGVWIWSTPSAGSIALGTPITSGEQNGVTIQIYRTTHLRGGAPTSTLDILVTGGSDTVVVSLGVGTDPSIARSIIRSLQHA